MITYKWTEESTYWFWFVWLAESILDHEIESRRQKENLVVLTASISSRSLPITDGEFSSSKFDRFGRSFARFRTLSMAISNFALRSLKRKRNSFDLPVCRRRENYFLTRNAFWRWCLLWSCSSADWFSFASSGSRTSVREMCTTESKWELFSLYERNSFDFRKINF